MLVNQAVDLRIGLLFAHARGGELVHGDGKRALALHQQNVQRDRFDKILIDQVIAAGATVRFGESVVAFVSRCQSPT